MIPLGFAIERLCYVIRSIIKQMPDLLIFLRGVILSWRRIWRRSDICRGNCAATRGIRRD